MKGTLAIAGLVIGIVTSIVLGLTSWHIDQDITGWKDRAQVSSEPNDMHEWMGKVQQGMEAWHMTQGNAAIFFPTPSTDIGLIYHTVKQHVAQAEVLTKMDRSTPQYQTGLDNLRGSIRELEIPAYRYWSNHDGLLINMLCWAGWITFFLFGVWWLIEF